MRYYPIFLNLKGRPCVVVGGGPVGERKVRTLLRAGASVYVISPEVTPRLALLAARKKIQLTSRVYRSGDLEKIYSTKGDGQKDSVRPVLVFAATNSRPAQELIHKDAETLGIPVNVADDAEESGFIVPATFSQGDLQVAISTSGASPALARQLRRRLQLTLGREYRGYLKFLREARKQVISTVPDEAQRAKIFRQLTGVEVMKWLWKGPPRQAAVDVREWLEKLTGAK
jgi:precorrin-2 dehydrogenase / sirohydrochlorin ferrochelatase